MKRKSLLFLLLMALFAPLAMNGQTQNTVLSQNFDGNGFQIHLDEYAAGAWYAYNAGNGNNWQLYQNSTYAHSGNYSMAYAYNSSNAANCYLVSEPFTVSAQMAELSVSLYESVMSSSYAETFEVFFIKASDVTTLAGVASATHYSAVASASYTNTSYAQVSGSVTSSALAGQSVRVVVHCTSIKDRYRLYIDDITVTETLEEACPKPTGLTATNLTPTSATLNWTSDAEDFYVRYRTAASTGTAAFFEDFENGIPATWTTIDSDNDGNNWLALSEISSVYTSYSGALSDWAHNGSNAAASPSYANGAGCFSSDQWLITPQISLGGTLKFYAASTYEDLDAFEVLLSTGGNSVSDFTVTLRTMQDAPYALNDGTADWGEITIDLSSYSGQGYIAIHHVSNCMYFLVIDDFGIYTSEEAGQWLPNAIGANTSDNSLDITGLTPETEYEWQVMADCGENGESNWSAMDTFTTPSNCMTPNGLTAEVTGNAANLSWTGYADTYDIHYREVDPTAPATVILTTTDIWNDGSGYQMLLDADATAYDNYETNGISDYSIFEYLIPTNATYDPNTTGFVINTSVSIQIPAGTYDWFITNPSPDYNKVYVAASNGNVGGSQNNYVFEAGKTYEFVPSLYGQNDGVDVTITAAWTLVEGVTNPYLLENLSSQTTYEFQVQGADCDNWSANATFTTGEFYTKHITGYTNNGGYYLIASPIGTVVPTQVTNMITDDDDNNNKTYDLYRFDQNPLDGLEWRNYRKGAFDLNVGQGYLYAHRTDVDLVFTGSAISESTYNVPLTKSASASGHEFPDWNLVGNPFADVAHFANNHPFYTLDVSGAYTLVSDASTTIESMQGVFVVAEEGEESITFVKGEPSKKSPKVTLNVSKGTEVGVIDRAIVCFGETRQMPKFQLFKNSTKVYIPMEGKDYALVRGEEMGAMPVNFKAEENGTYSMNFSCENVGFAYLHLIDNKTGNDVDLLKTPSYSFEAKTTDYESRFKLVFATGDNSNDDNFAFFSNGSFVINNDGAAELQVIDLMGRILSSETINGCTNVNVNAAPGVYMLRLINGDNVKVQKVVVK